MTKTLDQRVKMAMRGSRAHKERLMTDEDIDALYGFIEAEIIDAMKESAKAERQSCAMIADEFAGYHAGEMERLKRNDLAEVIEEKAIDVAKGIARRIRDRS